MRTSLRFLCRIERPSLAETAVRASGWTAGGYVSVDDRWLRLPVFHWQGRLDPSILNIGHSDQWTAELGCLAVFGLQVLKLYEQNSPAESVRTRESLFVIHRRHQPGLSAASAGMSGPKDALSGTLTFVFGSPEAGGAAGQPRLEIRWSSAGHQREAVLTAASVRQAMVQEDRGGGSGRGGASGRASRG